MSREELLKIIKTIRAYIEDCSNLSSDNVKVVIEARDIIEGLLPQIKEISANIGSINLDLIIVYVKKQIHINKPDILSGLTKEQYKQELRNIKLLEKIIFSTLEEPQENISNEVCLGRM